MVLSLRACLNVVVEAVHGTKLRAELLRCQSIDYSADLQSAPKRALWRCRAALRNATREGALRRATRRSTSVDAARLPPVDVVYTWVDSDDPAWNEQRLRWLEKEPARGGYEAGNRRYTNRDELRYSLRSLERNLPAVRRIFLVTNGQVPRWLRVDHPRLTIISHASIFDDPSHLPTFNSTAIETHLWRIDGLSEHFVYMNDDIFVLRPLGLAELVDEQGKCGIVFEHDMESRPPAEAANRAMLAYTREVFEKKLGALPIPNRPSYHGPVIHRRSVHEMLARVLRDELVETSASRFRNARCICLIQIASPQLALRRGLADETRLSWASMRLTSSARANSAAFRFIAHFRPQVFAVNDTVDTEPGAESGDLQRFLSGLFPEKSSFER